MEIDRPRLLTMLEELPRPERIALLRSLYMLTQSGLAEIAGVARTTATSWEAAQGGHEPGKMARNRLGTYFNLPAYVFADDWGAREAKRQRSSNAGKKPPAPIGGTIKVPESYDKESRPVRQVTIKRIG